MDTDPSRRPFHQQQQQQPRKNLNKSKLIFFKKKYFEPKEPTRCVQIVWPVKKYFFKK